jgi:hypothetical protein
MGRWAEPNIKFNAAILMVLGVGCQVSGVRKEK